MKQKQFQIMGQSYTLAYPEESQDSMEHAVQRVDAAMCEIFEKGKLKSRDRIAVLAALNIALEQAEQGSKPKAASYGNQPEQSTESEKHIHPRMQALLQRLGEVLKEDEKLL